jgi:hypothetical protein
MEILHRHHIVNIPPPPNMLAQFAYLWISMNITYTLKLFIPCRINIFIYYNQLNAQYYIHITVEILQILPEGGTFMPKHVAVMSVLLYCAFGWLQQMNILLRPTQFQDSALIASEVSVAPYWLPSLNTFKRVTKFPQHLPLPYLHRTSVSIHRNSTPVFQNQKFQSLILNLSTSVYHY